MANAQWQLFHIMQPGATSTEWDAHWQPRVDVCQTRDGLLIQVEIAGLDEANLRLHFEPGQLIVEGRRERPDWPAPLQCRQIEIEYGAFRRVVALPREADGEQISAQYQAGMLVITVPLKPLAAPRNLRVSID